MIKGGAKTGSKRASSSPYHKSWCMHVQACPPHFHIYIYEADLIIGVSNLLLSAQRFKY